MDYTDKINATNAKNSFMLHNGIRLTAMEKDYAKVEAHLTRENRNLYRITLLDGEVRLAAQVRLRLDAIAQSSSITKQIMGHFLIREPDSTIA